MNTYRASGYAFDQATRDWTKLVSCDFGDHMAAIRWCNMNRDWFKHLQVETIES